MISLIIIVTYWIDHIGVLCPDLWFYRVLGRLCAPLVLYAFILGWRYTSDRRKYCLRLCLCGFCADIVRVAIGYPAGVWFSAVSVLGLLGLTRIYSLWLCSLVALGLYFVGGEYVLSFYVGVFCINVLSTRFRMALVWGIVNLQSLNVLGIFSYVLPFRGRFVPAWFSYSFYSLHWGLLLWLYHQINVGY